MRIPNGFRADSMRTPKASRAGALYGTERYVTPRESIPLHSAYLTVAPSLAAANANSHLTAECRTAISGVVT